MAIFLTTKRRLSNGHPGRQSRRSQSIPRDRRLMSHFRALRFEPMEERTLLSVSMQPHYVVFDPTTNAACAASNTSNFIGPVASRIDPLGSATPPTTAFNPAQLKQAYGIDQIADGGVAQDGTGITVAIVDAYNDPKFVSRGGNSDVNQDTAFLASDLHNFDVQYGLAEPAGFFTKVDQTGGQNYPTGDTGWGTEIALDVEWVHSIAPGAKIVLIEANSNSFSDMMAAVDTARNYPGVSVVSMSWGAGEFSDETDYDAYFTTPGGHAGVTFVASTGDNGSPGEYPAYLPGVVAVGGTSLTLNGGSYSSERAWGGSGGGQSTYESEPSYQMSVQQSGWRQRSAHRPHQDGSTPDTRRVQSQPPIHHGRHLGPGSPKYAEH